MDISFLFSFAFVSPLFSAICKGSLDHFAFLHFFFLGMVLTTASYIMLQTSIQIYAGVKFYKTIFFLSILRKFKT